MSTTMLSPTSEWLPGPDAARMLSLPSTRALRRLAERGLLGVRVIPGCHPVYSRASLVKLAQESTRPAGA